MQRRVLLGAGAVVLVVAGVIVFRSTTHKQVVKVVNENIDQFVATLPPGYSVTHGATEFNALTGTLTVHDLMVKFEGKPNLQAETVTVSGADGPALRDVFYASSYPNNAPAWTDRRLLVTDATASALRITTQDANPSVFLIKSVTLHRLLGRPFAMPPTPENEHKPAFQADAALAFALDSFEIHDVGLAPAPPEPGHVSLGSLTLADYDSGNFGLFALKDAAADGVSPKPRAIPFHAAIGKIDLKSATLRPMLESIRATGQADKSSLTKLGTWYQEAGLTGLEVTTTPGPRFAIAEIRAETSPASSDGRVGGKADFTGMTAELRDTVVPPAAAPAIAAFGMKSLTLDIAATSHSTVPLRDLDLHEDINIHDLGSLHIDGAITGYDQAAASSTKPLNAFLAATLQHASFEWDDASLVNRVLAVAAGQTHTTPEAMRAQLAMPVVTLGLMIPDQPDVADQVTSFLNNPHTLIITMNPPTKLTFAEIGQAPVQQRAHLLGVHVQAK